MLRRERKAAEEDGCRSDRPKGVPHQGRAETIQRSLKTLASCGMIPAVMLLADEMQKPQRRANRHCAWAAEIQPMWGKEFGTVEEILPRDELDAESGSERQKVAQRAWQQA